MKKTLFAASICAVLSVPGMALACEKPQARPEIPDPATAVTAQMVKSNNEVREYVRATEAYLACAKLSSADTRREEDELRTFADAFNQTIRDFKARG